MRKQEKSIVYVVYSSVDRNGHINITGTLLTLPFKEVYTALAITEITRILKEGNYCRSCVILNIIPLKS